MRPALLLLLISLCAVALSAAGAPEVIDARQGRHSSRLYGEWFGRDLLVEQGASIEQLVASMIARSYPAAKATIRVLWIGPETINDRNAQAGKLLVEIDTGTVKFPVAVTVKRAIYKPTDADFRGILDKMLDDLRGNLTLVYSVEGAQR